MPFDRRVWQEACALRDAGWLVSVICPATADYPALEETIDGIDILRHPLPFEASGKLGFLAEYASALFHEFRLLCRVWRRRGISVIQGCNPPDLIFAVAAPFKLLGVRFVFDHHDICPELYFVKFQRRGFFYRLLVLCEWLTFRTADMVISTNETFREIAMARGGVRADRVESVYSYPDRARLYRVPPEPALRNGRSVVLGYIGIIGQQDGVDHLIHATQRLVRDLGCGDVQTVIVGDGPAAAGLRRLVEELGIADHVTFTGYLRGDQLLQALSTFDLAVIPDPMNAYNDKISMNKVFEYAILGIPTVAYRLKETMRLFGNAAVFAEGDDPRALAEAISKLVRDPELRAQLAQRSLDCAKLSFDWGREAEKYVAVIEAALERQTGRKRLAEKIETVS